MMATLCARAVFDGLAPLLAPMLEEGWQRRDLCIFATRVAIEVAAHFGIQSEPVAVRVVAYNAPFARHVAVNFDDVDDPTKPTTWGDGSWSVGIGCGTPNAPGRWDGHLVAVAEGCFGDFSIQQVERLQHGIQTGPALVGPYRGASTWKATNETGTVIEYQRVVDDAWRRAPDWTDEKRRRAPVGKLIRALREMEVGR
jgi:hypothetical protein